MIPSGLQALIEASQVLSQEAAPTAPGPQGPQPTVANQMMQQAEQAAQQGIQQMPQMQQFGRQAGIAGQLMAQQQAQQQKMAQDPQAVAQMAAQLLKQGVGGLPVNMQFREGGIIGFDGEEGSEVPESFAERQRRQMEEKGSIYDPYYGYPPGIREALKRDEEARREGRANPEFFPVPTESGEERIPRAKSEREAIEAEQKLKRDRLETMRMLQERRQAQRRGVEAALPNVQQAEALAGGAKALEEYYVPYPDRGPQRSTISPAPVVKEEAAPETQPPPSEKAPPPAVEKPGITAALPQIPRAVMPEAPTYEKIFAGVPEDEEAKAARGRLEYLRAQALAARKGAEDLESQGIAALTEAKSERQKLLKERRERDSFNKLGAFLRDLYTRGNEYDVVQKVIDAREDAAVQADLMHNDAVLKLRQAKQNREIGNLDLAAQNEKEALDLINKERDGRRLIANASAELAGKVYQSQSTEAIHYADRAAQAEMKAREMALKAQEMGDARRRDALIAAGSKLSLAQKSMQQTLGEEFKAYVTMRNIPGAKIDPNSPEERSYRNREQQLYRTTIQPLERLVEQLSNQVLGLETKPSQATGQSVSFTSLPK